jgi:hypothetical protein
MLLKYLDATRSLQGLRLGQGGLILGRYAGITDEWHQNSLIAVLYIAIKRPFENECKGVHCGAAQQRTLGFHTLSAISELSQTIARPCYIRCAGAL